MNARVQNQDPRKHDSLSLVRRVRDGREHFDDGRHSRLSRTSQRVDVRATEKEAQVQRIAAISGVHRLLQGATNGDISDIDRYVASFAAIPGPSIAECRWFVSTI